MEPGLGLTDNARGVTWHRVRSVVDRFSPVIPSEATKLLPNCLTALWQFPVPQGHWLNCLDLAIPRSDHFPSKTTKKGRSKMWQDRIGR